MAAKKSRRSKQAPVNPAQFRSEALAQALEKKDVAAVALALRNGNTVVPMMRAADPKNPADVGDVWVYRDPNTGDLALLLFSDATHKPENLPSIVGVFGPDWLKAFLSAHPITSVFLDVAGPHPMQASPAELLKALEA